MGRGKFKVKPTGCRNIFTHEDMGGGIPKARVGGKSVKNLHRKKTSSWNLPYWKPFLMALQGCKKQQCVKVRTAACVMKAAKICDSSKSENYLYVQKIRQEWEAALLERKKNNLDKIPTYILEKRYPTWIG